MDEFISQILRHKVLNKVLLLGAIIFSINLNAQESESEIQEEDTGIINIESFFSDKGPLVEMNLAKPFSPGSRFGIIALGEYSSTWDTKKQAEESGYMAQTHISYHILEHFDIFTGFFTSDVDGVRPTIGIQYLLSKGDFFFLAVPRMDLTQTHNGEILSVLEYTPRFDDNWSLYTRVEGLYNHLMDTGEHGYSYIRFRLGTSYKTFRFGLGANFTAYGPEKFKEQTYGVFAGVWLF